MSKKSLAYYIISGLLALFVFILNISTIYYDLFVSPLFRYDFFGAIFTFKKVLMVITASYVIAFNEVARRKKRWGLYLELIKGRKDIIMEKVDLFIIFALSLSFIFFCSLILNYFSFLLSILIYR
ncbi:MAG: hypothetical protein LBI71_06485 [Enterobacteriaceae bacterium]|jgi:hypothetical protein|nr:hypothetical protein [Enterobacteriaceae bacterium]